MVWDELAAVFTEVGMVELPDDGAQLIIYRCDECRALVANVDRMDHRAWHVRIGG